VAQAEECPLMSAVAECWNNTSIDKQKKIKINWKQRKKNSFTPTVSVCGKSYSFQKLKHMQG
jgi:hypothetical protein